MPSVLIVTPHFPPIDAADMHRVRMSLPYFEEFGWKPIVLCVDPEYTDGIVEPLLLETLPDDVSLYRCRAIKKKFSGLIGIGNIAIRALPYLYFEGCRIIKNNKIDLIYFSTTMFAAMILGRIWKSKFGVPFVIDMQDCFYCTNITRTTINQNKAQTTIRKTIN